ncbi:hypothetical protein ALC57_05079 [Trachymyrmex cornetzi]|uniref:Uncharacterized protein n=1 Tax=Trachymyrmex cornetzi TaxID=471704 RepID=A0A151JBQ2_9HYME|nr:hypothetical protein ALC57_05079 [Trachymyrmex cornetzi]
MKSPQGFTWKTVLSSKYLAGITSLMTFSMTALRSSSRLIFSLCCSDTTTVWTLIDLNSTLYKLR